MATIAGTEEVFNSLSKVAEITAALNDAILDLTSLLTDLENRGAIDSEISGKLSKPYEVLSYTSDNVAKAIQEITSVLGG